MLIEYSNNDLNNIININYCNSFQEVFDLLEGKDRSRLKVVSFGGGILNHESNIRNAFGIIPFGIVENYANCFGIFIYRMLYVFGCGMIKSGAVEGIVYKSDMNNNLYIWSGWKQII